MQLSTPLLIDMSGGQKRLPLEPEDANPTLGTVVAPTIACLLKGGMTIADPNLTWDTSFYFSTVQSIAASSGAVNSTVINLSKGMYTIDLEVAARFQGATPAAVGGADAFWSFLQNGIAMVVAATYHIVGTQARAQRRFRICVGDEILAVRRQTAATGVGQTIEAVFSLAIEREL